MKRSLALVALSALALGACQISGGSTIKIGLISPLTGDTASLGTDVLNGVRMAVQEINDKGGIDGKKVELVAEDGRCASAEANSAAQKLVNIDKVVAIVGGFCSGETLAASKVIEPAKVILLSPGSSSPDITKAGAFVFRNYPSDALKTVATAKVFGEKGYKKVAMISENTDFCQGVRKGMIKDVGSGAIVFDEVVEPGTKDFRTLITRLKDIEFDVFYMNTNGDAPMGPMAQQFREQGFTQPIFSHEVADSATLGAAAAEAVEGLELVTVPTAGEGTDFEATFTAAYGKPQSSIAFAAHAYDAANVLFQAIGTAGTNGDEVRAYLANFTMASPYEGVVGKWGFDENGDVVGVPFVLKVFKDGKTSKVKDIAL